MDFIGEANGWSFIQGWRKPEIQKFLLERNFWSKKCKKGKKKKPVAFLLNSFFLPPPWSSFYPWLPRILFWHWTTQSRRCNGQLNFCSITVFQEENIDTMNDCWKKGRKKPRYWGIEKVEDTTNPYWDEPLPLRFNIIFFFVPFSLFISFYMHCYFFWYSLSKALVPYNFLIANVVSVGVCFFSFHVSFLLSSLQRKHTT